MVLDAQTAATAAPPPEPKHSVLGRLLRSPGVVLVLALVAIIAVGGLTTPGFIAPDNLVGILRTSSIVGIAAVGMSFVTIGGFFISMSVQQNVMLAAMLFAFGTASTGQPAIALLGMVVALLLVNALQGVFVAIGLNPIVATLAVGSMIYGGVQWLSGGTPVTFRSPIVEAFDDFAPLGIPAVVFLFVVVALVATVIIERTVFGRRLRLHGVNPQTARMSGVSTTRLALAAFLLLGVASAIAGALAAIRVGQATGDMLGSLTIDTVAAVLVGGVAIEGGRGKPLGAALGAVFIATIDNLMILNDVSTGIRQTVAGALVIAAVVLMHVVTRRSK